MRWLDLVEIFVILINWALIFYNLRIARKLKKQQVENLNHAFKNCETSIQNLEDAQRNAEFAAKNQMIAQKLRDIELQKIGLKGGHLEGN